ncbi:MAG: efflux transporter outer membrane subunit [Parachlamydiaceae bacterium]|nr:efflux transporter outer membrane subunit [Parachlamydiaceae bacterium]
MFIKRYCLLTFSLFSGCTVGPTYTPPEFNMPCSWHSDTFEGMEVEETSKVCWWENFNDPVLNSLIERAASQNLDLAIATTRILQVRREKLGKSAEAYPHVDLSANYDHVYYSKNALVKGLLDTAGNCRDNNIKRNVNFFELGFDADWEIDLFGLRKHEMNAIEAQERASEEALRDVWVSLSAEIARSYIELRGNQRSLYLLKRNLNAQEGMVELNSDLVAGGVISELDAKQISNQFNNQAAQKPLAELSISKSIHHLSILLSYAPGDLFDELAVEDDCIVPSLPYEKPICIPSELLRRRPDIRRAERELAVATEKVGSAIAALYPRFSLQGFIGEISTNIGSIFNPASLMWAVGPQLLVPVFNSRLILEDVQINKILTQKALYEYQKVVLTALEETENAIASFHFEGEHTKRLAEVFEGTKNALELTQQLYHTGVKNNLDVLAAIRAQIDAESNYMQSQISQLLNYIALNKALAGADIDLE